MRMISQMFNNVNKKTVQCFIENVEFIFKNLNIFYKNNNIFFFR